MRKVLIQNLLGKLGKLFSYRVPEVSHPELMLSEHNCSEINGQFPSVHSWKEIFRSDSMGIELQFRFGVDCERARFFYQSWVVSLLQTSPTDSDFSCDFKKADCQAARFSGEFTDREKSMM
jgi:hypothetical protein